MSLIKKLGRALGGLARTGIAGPVVSQTVGRIGLRSGAGAASLMPGVTIQPAMGALPPIVRALPGIAGAGVGLVATGARAVIRSATYYCKRYPAWCVAAGGLPAVVDLVTSGQLPPHRARRARGITAREMRSFKKVHRVLSQFCAPRMRIRRKAPCR